MFVQGNRMVHIVDSTQKKTGRSVATECGAHCIAMVLSEKATLPVCPVCALPNAVRSKFKEFRAAQKHPRVKKTS